MRRHWRQHAWGISGVNSLISCEIQAGAWQVPAVIQNLHGGNYDESARWSSGCRCSLGARDSGVKIAVAVVCK